MICCSSSELKTVFWFFQSSFTCVHILEASTKTTLPSVFSLSIKSTETFVQVVAKILLGILTTHLSIFSSISFSLIFFSIPLWAVIKPVGKTIAAFHLSLKE